MRCWDKFLPTSAMRRRLYEYVCMYVCMHIMGMGMYVARVRQWASITLQLYTLKQTAPQLTVFSWWNRKEGGREGGRKWGRERGREGEGKPHLWATVWNHNVTKILHMYVCMPTSFWGTTVLLTKRKELFIVLLHTFSVFVHLCVSVCVCM